MGARGLLVKIVTCDHFVLDALVVEHDGVVCVVAAELEQVLHNELLILAPPYFKPRFLQLLSCRAFDGLRVQ